MDDLRAKIEAILFVAGEPVAVGDLAHALNLTAMEMSAALEEMREYLDANSGLKLNYFGSQVQLSIQPQYAAAVEALLNPVQRMPLTAAVMPGTTWISMAGYSSASSSSRPAMP